MGEGRILPFLQEGAALKGQLGFLGCSNPTEEREEERVEKRGEVQGRTGRTQPPLPGSPDTPRSPAERPRTRGQTTAATQGLCLMFKQQPWRPRPDACHTSSGHTLAPPQDPMSSESRATHFKRKQQRGF